MEDLISAYHSFNGVDIAELQAEPSPLEFMRFVSRNLPFIVRKATSRWPASRWNVPYLDGILGDQKISVAVTPHGNADSVVHCPTGTYFVKPLEEKESFSSLIRYIQKQELERNDKGRSNNAIHCVKYAQSQNDNMRGEFSPLLKDVEPEIPWARVALQLKPDAINLWIGNSHSVTELHKDHYENIFCQLLGKKHFVLIPPFNVACVNEQLLPVASYRWSEAQHHGTLTMKKEMLKVVPDPSQDAVPCAIWDPDDPHKNCTKFSHLCTPLRITLEEGDLFYLPALWFHKVSQSCNEEGISCSLNYWYDMDFQSPLAPAFEYLRQNATQAP